MNSPGWKLVVTDRLLELVMVFIGVYAAFYLNNVQLRDEQKQRHRQLIVYLEKEAASSAKRDHDAGHAVEQKLNDLTARIASGQMPELEPTNWEPNYDVAQLGSLMQAGGLEVLDLRTVARLREIDSISRNGYAIMANYQQLTNQLIATHAGEPREYFYDPATKQLRRQFAVYLESLKADSRFLHQLSEADDRLLVELTNERDRFSKE